MNNPTLGDSLALKLVRFAVPLVVCLTWAVWSGAALAADIKDPHSIKCKAMEVQGYQSVKAMKLRDVNDQPGDPSLVFEWRPRTAEGPVIEVNGVRAKLVAITDNSLVAVHGFSDPATIDDWLYAINFRLEIVVGVNVKSNVVSLKGRAAEFSCDFEATH